MSTSLLYHRFGIVGRGYYYERTRYEKGRTIFRIRQDPTTLQCPRCGSRKVKKKGTVCFVHSEAFRSGASPQ